MSENLKSFLAFVGGLALLGLAMRIPLVDYIIRQILLGASGPAGFQ